MLHVLFCAGVPRSELNQGMETSNIPIAEKRAEVVVHTFVLQHYYHFYTNSCTIRKETKFAA